MGLTRQDRGVALGGFMGSGKSTVGRILSDVLALPFVDVDAVLVERFGPISRQFSEHGEAVFRARERMVIEEIGERMSGVVATGGGAWVDPRNRQALARHHRLVVLHAPLDVLRQRVGAAADRPAWTADVEALFASRRAAYQMADRMVDTAGRGPAAVAEEIRAWMTA